MKFKAVFWHNSEEKTELGVFDSKEKAIEKLLNKGGNDYCLDSYEVRKQALEERDFCMCGCGPRQMEIITIE
ncbi:MAG: hypothetical protein IKT40_12060 [Bacilli bacterium]|nr:hypothetical protein [Bacilli bacterium]